MKITITGRHMEVTDGLRTHIESGLEKLRAHFDQVLDVDVVLAVEKDRHIAEINMHANGVRMHSKETSPDMYASVDAALAKLDSQIRKHKSRINRHKPRNGSDLPDFAHAIISFEAEIGGNGTQAAATAVDDDPDTEICGHRVVKHEKLTMKPLTVDEAVMQIDLIDEPFLVFSNAETSRVNVLYDRHDGTYGLIEPAF